MSAESTEAAPSRTLSNSAPLPLLCAGRSPNSPHPSAIGRILAHRMRTGASYRVPPGSWPSSARIADYLPFLACGRHCLAARRSAFRARLAGAVRTGRVGGLSPGAENVIWCGKGRLAVACGGPGVSVLRCGGRGPGRCLVLVALRRAAPGRVG